MGTDENMNVVLVGAQCFQMPVIGNTDVCNSLFQELDSVVKQDLATILDTPDNVISDLVPAMGTDLDIHMFNCKLWTTLIRALSIHGAELRGSSRWLKEDPRSILFLDFLASRPDIFRAVKNLSSAINVKLLDKAYFLIDVCVSFTTQTSRIDPSTWTL